MTGALGQTNTAENVSFGVPGLSNLSQAIVFPASYSREINSSTRDIENYAMRNSPRCLLPDLCRRLGSMLLENRLH